MERVPVDAVVAAELRVLGADHGRHQHRRDRIEMDVVASGDPSRELPPDDQQRDGRCDRVGDEQADEDENERQKHADHGAQDEPERTGLASTDHAAAMAQPAARDKMRATITRP